jgi:hypothetical protein
MSKLVKIAVIIAIGAVAIAARQFVPAVDMSGEGALAVSAAQVVPLEMMHHAGPLPETPVSSHF